MPHTSQILPTEQFSFYTAADYRRQLLAHIKKTRAGDRLLLMSMTFEPTEPDIAAVMAEVEAAAARGVQVTLAVDAHSFLIQMNHLPGPLWTRKRMPNRMPATYRHKLQILERINAYPTGHADIINIPQRRLSLPISGRSHIKAAIVNDKIFIGGCNLQGSKFIDLMVGWQSAADAEKLYAVLNQVIHGGHTSRALAGIDRVFSIGQETNLLIDSGARRQSRIFDEALNLIDAAEDWLVITCQYFPNSITAQHLVRAARRGVKVEVIYTHPKHHGVIGGFGQRVSIFRERTRVPKSLFAHALDKTDPMLHAKLIACDKGVMIGSHNYVRAGVILGTAEIALKSSDEAMAREAVKKLHSGLKAARQLQA
jgi:cardiolipin synthase